VALERSCWDSLEGRLVGVRWKTIGTLNFYVGKTLGSLKLVLLRFVGELWGRSVWGNV